MATDNKGVMVYLPPDVEEFITEYCVENNIYRKSKEGESTPSLGTGVVIFLKSALTGKTPGEILTKKRGDGTELSKDDVLEIIEEYFSDYDRELLARVKAIEHRPFATDDHIRELARGEFDRLTNTKPKASRTR